MKWRLCFFCGRLAGLFTSKGRVRSHGRPRCILSKHTVRFYKKTVEMCIQSKKE